MSISNTVRKLYHCKVVTYYHFISIAGADSRRIFVCTINNFLGYKSNLGNFGPFLRKL